MPDNRHFALVFSDNRKRLKTLRTSKIGGRVYSLYLDRKAIMYMIRKGFLKREGENVATKTQWSVDVILSANNEIVHTITLPSLIFLRKDGNMMFRLGYFDLPLGKDHHFQKIYMKLWFSHKDYYNTHKVLVHHRVPGSEGLYDRRDRLAYEKSCKEARSSNRIEEVSPQLPPPVKPRLPPPVTPRYPHDSPQLPPQTPTAYYHLSDPNMKRFSLNDVISIMQTIPAMMYPLGSYRPPENAPRDPRL